MFVNHHVVYNRECELLTYGHVIGGVDADRGHVGARAGADVGDTPLQHLPGTTQLWRQSCYDL